MINKGDRYIHFLFNKTLFAGVLPKSTNQDHIRQNIKLDFELSTKDMQSLSKLNVKQKYAWDSSLVF